MQPGCKASNNNKGSIIFAPCFYVETPRVINLPDSFNFKEKKYYAIFDITCYFDSTGNILEILPQQIYIKNSITNNIEKEFFYWKGWEDSAINMTKQEGVRYVDWIQKELPLIARLKRYPADYKCIEQKNNRIGEILDYRLE
jgi:hypothetical protein